MQLLAIPEQGVEDDEVGRDFGSELADAAVGGVEPHLECIEVESAAARDHDLAVHRRARRKLFAQRFELREVA